MKSFIPLMFVISMMLVFNMVMSTPTFMVRYDQGNNLQLAEKLILNEIESIKTSKTLLIDFIYAAIKSVLAPTSIAPPPQTSTLPTNLEAEEETTTI